MTSTHNLLAEPGRFSTAVLVGTIRAAAIPRPGLPPCSARCVWFAIERLMYVLGWYRYYRKFTLLHFEHPCHYRLRSRCFGSRSALR